MSQKTLKKTILIAVGLLGSSALSQPAAARDFAGVQLSDLTDQNSSAKSLVQNLRGKFVDAASQNAQHLAPKNSDKLRVPERRNPLKNFKIQFIEGSPDPFTDIARDPARSAIRTLANLELVQTSTKKFHPQNYLRFGELLKLSYGVESLQLRQPPLDDFIALLENAQYRGHFPENLKTNDFVTPETLQTFFQKFDDENLQNFKNFPRKLRDGFITRGDFAQALVQNYDLDELLDQHGLSPASEATKFFSQNQIRSETRETRDQPATRADFLTRSAKIFLKFHPDAQISLSNNFSDASDPSFTPFLLYSQQLGLTDFLRETERKQNFIHPTRPISLHEIHQSLAPVADIPVYDAALADQEIPTKKDLADLLHKKIVQPRQNGGLPTTIIRTVSDLLAIL